jgi:16S rRNA processing protein RimM
VATAAGDDLVLVGRIARPHGLRGQVIVDPETDFLEERFAPGAALLRRVGSPADLETLRIASVRFHRGRPIVAFEGVDTIERAEALDRAELWIRAESRPVLPEGEFYHDALIGCRVEMAGGEVVGTVDRVEGSRGVPLLVVLAARDGRSEVLIPLAETICRIIDPAARRIVIDPPEGLLELNS